MQWAELKGAGCDECRALNLIFSRGVDAVKSGEQQSIPPHLVPPASLPRADDDDPAGSKPLAVWHVLEDMAEAAVKEVTLMRLQGQGRSNGSGIAEGAAAAAAAGAFDMEDMVELLQGRDSGLSQYKLLCLLEK
jgi:hypothetical protein